MREYVKEIFNPCAGSDHWSACEILELPLKDPMFYVQQQCINEKKMQFLSSTKDGSTVIEAIYASGIINRYTFSPL